MKYSPRVPEHVRENRQDSPTYIRRGGSCVLTLASKWKLTQVWATLLVFPFLVLMNSLHCTASYPQAPGGTKGGEPQQFRAAQANDERFAVPSVVGEPIASDLRQYNDNKTSTKDSVEIIGSILTVIATVAIAIFNHRLSDSTKKLWEETAKTGKTSDTAAKAAEKSAAVSEQALLNTERAYVYLKRINTTFMFDSSTQFVRAWKFTPVFENSGFTPTKRSILHVSFQIGEDDTLERDGFPDHWPEGSLRQYSPFFVAPQAEKMSMPLDLHVVELEHVRQRRKQLFIWGWIDYDDIFRGTDRHRMEFGVEVFVNGDPAMIDTTFTFREFRQFNGTDDDCYRKPKPYEEIIT
jgi:hypothetical protein